MKIDRNDLQVFKENALELFQQGIKAKVTKEKYTRVLRRILTDILENVLEGTFEERASQLVNHTKKDPDWGMSVLLALSKKLRERTELPKNDPNYLNPGSFPTNSTLASCNAKVPVSKQSFIGMPSLFSLRSWGMRE